MVQILDGLKQNLVDFPNIDLDKISEISKSRDKTHYEIPSSVTLTSVSGLGSFFDVLFFYYRSIRLNYRTPSLFQVLIV